MKFIVRKVNHCCFSGTALQTFSLRLLGGDRPPSPLVSATDIDDNFCLLSLTEEIQKKQFSTEFITSVFGVGGNNYEVVIASI